MGCLLYALFHKCGHIWSTRNCRKYPKIVQCSSLKISKSVTLIEQVSNISATSPNNVLTAYFPYCGVSFLHFRVQFTEKPQYLVWAPIPFEVGTGLLMSLSYQGPLVASSFYSSNESPSRFFHLYGQNVPKTYFSHNTAFSQHYMTRFKITVASQRKSQTGM